MSYPLTDIDGIDGNVAVLLKKAGIRSTGGLLAKASTASGRKIIARKTGIVEKTLLCWVNAADRMRIKGISREHARLLQAAGVVTVRELIYRNPRKLAEAMANANREHRLVRVLPSEKAVVRWIDNARKLDGKISS